MNKEWSTEKKVFLREQNSLPRPSQKFAAGGARSCSGRGKVLWRTPQDLPADDCLRKVLSTKLLLFLEKSKYSGKKHGTPVKPCVCGKQKPRII